MDDATTQFASLLFRDHPESVEAFRQATANPVAFIARHADELGYFSPKPGWAPDTWRLLLNVGQLRGWVWEVDWREAADEIVAAVKDLLPAVPLVVDWDELSAQEQETREFLGTLARAIEQVGEVLVSLDIDSDSYPLALIPSGSVAEAVRLAQEIGGRVDSLGT